jgi:FAD/FMN-containing dehydrogenase
VSITQEPRIALIEPDGERYDAARQAYNLRADQRPAAIAFPETAQDVAEVVRFARARGLRVAPQRTGHNAVPLGAIEDAVLLRTDRLQGVAIDAAARSARVQAGAQWQDVVPQAAELGLAALHGSAPDIGIVGYSLGGGVGWYARKLGLATNSVTGIELVTADGELVRADHDNEAELFWALRGGGGSFGVVTALEFALYPIPEVYAGALFFPFERSSEVLHTWLEWTRELPEEVTTSARMMQFPPLPELPDFLRGKSYALIDGAAMTGAAEGQELFRPLTELGPVIDTLAMVSPAVLPDMHMDPPDPLPFVSDHSLTGELPAGAIDGLVAAAGPGTGSPLAIVELRHTGGALSRPQPHHGALASLPGAYMSFAGGATMADGDAERINAALERVMAALGPYDAGRYFNWVEEPTDAAGFYEAETYRRLQAVKAELDPEDVFRANHQITTGADR